MKDDAIILHPLPRLDEISTDVVNPNIEMINVKVSKIIIGLIFELHHFVPYLNHDIIKIKFYPV